LRLEQKVLEYQGSELEILQLRRLESIAGLSLPSEGHTESTFAQALSHIGKRFNVVADPHQQLAKSVSLATLEPLSHSLQTTAGTQSKEAIRESKDTMARVLSVRDKQGLHSSGVPASNGQRKTLVWRSWVSPLALFVIAWDLFPLHLVDELKRITRVQSIGNDFLFKHLALWKW
jgi:hypothetical protein